MVPYISISNNSGNNKEFNESAECGNIAGARNLSEYASEVVQISQIPHQVPKRTIPRQIPVHIFQTKSDSIVVKSKNLTKNILEPMSCLNEDDQQTETILNSIEVQTIPSIKKASKYFYLVLDS